MAIAKKTMVSTFSMGMMTAAAVVSLRGLPMMAKEQPTLFVYIGFATFIFSIPAAFVSAELGGAFSDKGGGVYTWVKEGFGSRWGFVAIWLQWSQNVVWYPTELAFSAAALAYVSSGGRNLRTTGLMSTCSALPPSGFRRSSLCAGSMRSPKSPAGRFWPAPFCPA